MNDFVVYHNPDSMGYSAENIDRLGVLTNKRVSADAIGDRVWLLTGEGKPRNYYLVSWFTIAEISSGRDEGFKTAVSGENGKNFTPLVPLDGAAEWFQKFKTDQGNFAFGFSKITDPNTVTELEKAANIGAAKNRVFRRFGGRDMILRERAKATLRAHFVNRRPIEEIIEFLSDVISVEGNIHALTPQSYHLLTRAEEEIHEEFQNKMFYDE